MNSQTAASASEATETVAVSDAPQKPNGVVTCEGQITAAEMLSLRARMSDYAEHEDILSLAERLKWFALVVPAGKEFVAQKILRRYGLKTFVPVRREWRLPHRFTDQKELFEYAMTPRYVFAGFETGVPLWFKLFKLPLIGGVVGIQRVPLELPRKHMVAMIKRFGGGLNAATTEAFMRPKPEHKPGDQVRITEGPFVGMNVPVLSIAGSKAKVALALFGGVVTNVDLPLDYLEPV